MRTAALTLTFALLATAASAQQALTTNTLRLSPGQASPPATIADMAFLLGHWTGTGLGGQFEEIWTAPKKGVMLGMYRGLKDDAPVFYDVMHFDGMAIKPAGPDAITVYLAIESKKDGATREAIFTYTRIKG